MTVTTEVNGWYDIYNMCWGGAKDTLQDIAEAYKTEEFVEFLEEIFFEGATDTEINDFIWFERNYIYQSLGMTEEEEEEEEEEE